MADRQVWTCPDCCSGDTRYYPADIWAARGALVLKVNYRGSAAYGEAFRRLNIRNLGVGDAWDVLSGVDNLVAKGWVDPQKDRLYGLEPGRIHFRVSHDQLHKLCRNIRRRRDLRLGDVLLQHGHYDSSRLNYLGDNPVNDPEIYRRPLPSANVKTCEDADADPARRTGQARADRQRLRIAPGTRRSRKSRSK